MFPLKRKTPMERATEALQETVSYTSRVAHDRRLRADLRSAIGHARHATKLVRREGRRPRGASRLAADKRLRKSIRGVVDDIASAAGRMQRKRRTHRVRNALLIAGGTGAAIAATTRGRRRVVRGRAPEATTPA